MQLQDKLFLEALKASLTNSKVNWDFEMEPENWKELFALAESQKVLPLIFEAVYACPCAKQADEQLFLTMKHRSIGLMVNQLQKTEEFLKLYKELDFRGICPLVVKGIICRELYPNPDLRISADEDLLVDERNFAKAVEILQACGMKPLGALKDMEAVHEIGFVDEKGVSYIELHKQLFPESSKAYGDLNQYFTDAFKSFVPVEVRGRTVYTMEPGMHLFYLICHAFKHFVHSGFGIRQVCDIVMFANAYGQEIDWQRMLLQCREIHADKFAAALFRIGKNYLVFDEAKSGYPKQWQEIEADETDLLLELLRSGIYGGSSMERRHSSNITLEAVAAEKKGKRPANAVAASLFLTAKELEGKYTYLKKRPYLLPVAWSERILKYHKENGKTKGSNAAAAIWIGNRRIELLKKYGILENSRDGKREKNRRY